MASPNLIKRVTQHNEIKIKKDVHRIMRNVDNTPQPEFSFEAIREILSVQLHSSVRKLKRRRKQPMTQDA